MKTFHARSGPVRLSYEMPEMRKPADQGFGGLEHMSRRSVMILTMAGLIAGAMHGLADEPTARVSAQPGAISGLVVDLEGRPVAGADVWAVARQERFGPTRSGPDGRFRLAELKPDKPVTVWADAPGLARARHDDVHIFPGKDRDLGRLTLLPGTRMQGRIVDSRGKPLVGAGVQLELYRFRSAIRSPRRGPSGDSTPTARAVSPRRRSPPATPTSTSRRTGQGPHLRRKDIRAGNARGRPRRRHAP